MKRIYVESPNKLKKAIPKIEKKIKINLSLKGNNLSITGNEFNEYQVEDIVKAIDFGFEIEDALMLANDNFNLEFINIKEHTRRKNLSEVRARVIGTDGKAKKTIETLTGARVVIHDNQVGFISDVEHLEALKQGLILLIQGAKHGNAFAYIEKQNANLRRIDEEDLGLRDPKKDLKNLD